ncbi:MAG TPA: ATP-binding protein [Acidimicrobiia bacterium]|nr:ATP-binding protein [Acidimicrobiia bacterium]
MRKAVPRLPSGFPTAALRLLAAVGLPGVATGVASLSGLQSPTSETNAAMLYLMSVVGAALIGGLRGGLIASFLSFLGLNFFFTPPLRTFAVAKGEDLLALFAFLAVSILVATLLTRTLSQRTRAERGEHEARLLYRMSSLLLGGAPLPSVLGRFAGDVVELLGLARCEVHTLRLDGSLVMAACAGSPPDGAAGSVAIPLRTERGTFGQVKVFPEPSVDLGHRELELATAFAGQLALAVEAAMLAEQTRASRAEAEASRVRAALFSSVTHDLRTPLASIKAAATSLLDQGVTFNEVQRKDLLSTIAEESDRLNRLIANLLDLSRLRAGALVPEKTAAPVEDVVEAAVHRLQRRWKDVGIHVQVPETLPLVPMDLIQIDQVVSNLLENAVKYASNGIPIEVRATADGPWVEVAVADGGPGIPPEDRERVFEEFFRRDTGGGQGGVGLGLAISRAIVEAHGGSMWVGDTPGGGATIGFRLPLARAPGAPPAGPWAGLQPRSQPRSQGGETP